MPQLFVLKSEAKNRYYDKAYTDKNKADYVARCLHEYYGNYYKVEAVDLPFIGRSVCYMYLYRGFDYDIEIYNVDAVSDIYSCADMAKQDKLWREFLAIAESDSSKHIVTDNKVASLDHGEEFSYGDAMAGLFNLTIKRIRVIKEVF